MQRQGLPDSWRCWGAIFPMVALQ